MSGLFPHERGGARRRLSGYGLALMLACALAACERPTESAGSFPATNTADCLPNVTLLDQSGRSLSLAALKGKPVLVDFIYTSCTGPCPTLTAKLGSVAKRLGADLGRNVVLVSITLDPEHDRPAELSDYARKQQADDKGWLFLTGSPAQIERVLAAYKLRRQREADGSVTHMVATFLLGPDGHQVRQYNGLEVRPETVAADVERLLGHG